MIQAQFFKDSEGIYRGFSLVGHAGYAEAGQDIVCAAVSALAINTVNSIEEFTDDRIDYWVEEDTGMLTFRFNDGVSAGSRLLIDSLMFGLSNIAEKYAEETYIQIVVKEV